MTMIRSSLITVATLATLALAVPAAATPPTGVLDDHAGAGAVAGTSDLVAWSAWDGTQFRLTNWRAGAVEPLPVAGSPLPFGVSAGTGSGGATLLVWSRCSAPLTPAGCDIVRFDPARPTAGEQRVAFAASSGAEETIATADAGRLAYASTAKRSTLASVIVRRLDGRGPVRRFAIGPRRFGTDVLGPGTTAERTVTRRVITGLALRGDTLAAAGRAMTKSGSPGVCGQSFVRMVSLTTGRQRQVAAATCGLSGASYGAPAFDPRGRLWYVRTCNSDPSACRGVRGAPQRFDPRTGRTSPLSGLPVVSALATSGSSLVANVQAAVPTGACLATIPAGWGPVPICDEVRVLAASTLPR